ncbi:MAG: MOSC domain-containing protein [Steroidobacteraceae bacterium]
MAVRIESLACYPIKGCHRVECESTELLHSGLRHDREWMLVDPNGQFVTQRTDAVLATLAPSIDAGAQTLTVNAPGRSALRLPLAARGERCTVRIWKDTCAADDQGDEAAAWFSSAVGRPLRLVRFPDDGVRHANPQFARDDHAPVRFPDAYPILVTQSASLAAINAAIAASGAAPGEAPLPMTRFRPNIVLAGLAPFEEDRIDRLRIGRVELRLAKPSTRCIVTTTDQESGARGVEPLPTLKKLRWSREFKGVTFGENATVLQPGTLRVGDVVEVIHRR